MLDYDLEQQQTKTMIHDDRKWQKMTDDDRKCPTDHYTEGLMTRIMRQWHTLTENDRKKSDN